MNGPVRGMAMRATSVSHCTVNAEGHPAPGNRLGVLLGRTVPLLRQVS